MHARKHERHKQADAVVIEWQRQEKSPGVCMANIANATQWSLSGRKRRGHLVSAWPTDAVATQ